MPIINLQVDERMREQIRTEAFKKKVSSRRWIVLMLAELLKSPKKKVA